MRGTGVFLQKLINGWISYKCDTKAHANTKQVLAEVAIMQGRKNVLLSYP